MSSYANHIAQAPRTLTQRETGLLLKTTGEHVRGFRDHVLFAMALGTGLREHELLALNVGDIFMGQRARTRVLLRVFKGARDGETQEVLLNQRLRAKLDKLYKLKRRQGEGLSNDAPLFISRNGNRLSARQLRHAFKVWQGRAGIEHLFNFHTLRHTACTNIYRQSKDIRLTQRFARHKSILTAAIYTHPTEEDLMRSIERLNC